MLKSDRTVFRVVALALFAVLMVSPLESVQAAANRDEAPSVTLQYRGADLDSPEGVATLYRRIRAAASSVCGAYDRALLEEKQQWRQCVDEAVARAVASVNSESLNSYYWSKIHRRNPWIEAPAALAARE
jgi:UrcA family protein